MMEANAGDGKSIGLEHHNQFKLSSNAFVESKTNFQVCSSTIVG